MSDPSIPGQGFGFGGGGAGDDGIDLSLGLDTTGGLGGFDPVPEGTHKFRVEGPPEVEHTGAGEIMLVLKLQVSSSNVPGATGMVHTERIVVPGQARRQSEPDKWQTMSRILRTKLEAMTGHAWRDDNIKLRPRELAGCEFIATVKHKTESYQDKQTGEWKEGTNADLSRWTATTPGIAGAPVGNGAVVSGQDMAAQLAQQGFGGQPTAAQAAQQAVQPQTAPVQQPPAQPAPQQAPQQPAPQAPQSQPPADPAPGQPFQL